MTSYADPNTPFVSAASIVSGIKAVGDKRTIIVHGENGIGKTAILQALRADPAYSGYFFSVPVVAPELADGSVWMPDLDRENGVSRELPNERFGVSKHNQYGVPNGRPVCIFIDELYKAQRRTQQCLSPIIYDRQIGPFKLPEGSIVIAATNLGIEGLGDISQPHMRNRITQMWMRKPTADEWLVWAVNNGIHHAITASVSREHPEIFDSFLDYEPGGKYHGRDLKKDNPMVFNPRDPSQLAYVTPRSLHAASDILHAADKHKLDAVTVDAMLTGTVGAVYATKLGAYVRLGDAITPFDAVMADPDKAAIHPDPLVQVVQVSMLVNKSTTDRAQAEKTCRYVNRLHHDMQTLFVGSINDSQFAVVYCTVPAYGEMLKIHRELMT
jgi:hypothetical protein